VIKNGDVWCVRREPTRNIGAGGKRPYYFEAGLRQFVLDQHRYERLVLCDEYPRMGG
jgi:hypothetical protein